MLRKAFLLLLMLILIPCISHAKTEIIFVDHKYVMGDNDSKTDARRMCFLEAKRKVLEKAGTYIESHTQVKNYRLTKDEINSYAAALLKVETVKEEWKFVGENMAVFLTVKAEVDSSYIEKQLAKIKKDASVQKKIKEQQAQIRELERKFIDLQKQLRTADASKTLTLRKQRAEIDWVSEPKAIDRDGRVTAYDNGTRFTAYDNGTVKDTKTGLVWASKANGWEGINWKDAKRYCENYPGGGYTDWRMPTQDELAGIYDPGKKNWLHGNYVTALIEIESWWCWASETRGSEVAVFGFRNGHRFWYDQSNSNIDIDPRALPVRGGN